MRSLCLYALLLAAAGSAAACDLTLEGAWVRTPPPGATVMAGYGKLGNPGHGDSALVRAESPDFGRVELHSMVMDGDVMRMRKLDRIDVKAGETVELKPGGLHLMLFEPKRELAEGAEIPLTLTLACDTEIAATAKVLAKAPDASADSADEQKHDPHHHH
jgi:copper(I)-binding protein